MKKIIIILSFFFFANIATTKAQTVTDTLSYLQTIVTNKANYIGKPFSVLLNDLQIQIKFFSPFAAIHYDKNKETSTSFAFYFPQTADEIYLTYPCIEIHWQTPLNANQSSILYTNNNGGGWAANAVTFYSTGIIADIQVRQ